MLEGPLAALPRRLVDKAYALRNEGPKKRVYKLNSTGGTGREAGGIVLRRGTEFEYQRESGARLWGDGAKEAGGE